MRLTLVLLAGLLATAPRPAAAETASDTPQSLRSRGDALRAERDFAGSLAAYQAELAAAGPSADLWKRIGWSLRGLHRIPEAIAALRRATELDPADREAQDDLAALVLARGLSARGWMGGTEPGNAQQAFEGRLQTEGFDRLMIEAGGGWSDAIFFESSKGYASVTRFLGNDSFLRGELSARRYAYSGANRPTPDSNAYDLVPRAELQAGTRFGPVSVELAWQLMAPNFVYDTATRFLTTKVSGEVEARVGGGFSLLGMAAVLVDPDPAQTLIKDRPLPTAPAGTVCAPGVASVDCAAASKVVYRRQVLVGGGAAWRGDRWRLASRYIPNRDLDSGYAWSVISTVEHRPIERLDLELIWVLDRYASTSGPTFAGKNGNIWWAKARYGVLPALTLGAGLKWVSNPGPSSPTSSAARNDGTLLLDVEYRTGLH